MRKNIPLFNWQIDLQNSIIDKIDNDFVLMDKPIIKSTFVYPFKVDVTTAIICLSGILEGEIDLEPFRAQPSTMVIILSDQILQYKYMSEDFTGLFIVMSNKFTQSLNLQQGLSLFLNVHNNPTILFNQETLEAIVSWYYMMQKVVRSEENPYRLEAVRNMTRAFFYGVGYKFHKIAKEKSQSRQNILFEDFLTLVKEHNKEQRGVKFYADKLCITPKYLSTLIKDLTGRSSNEWIDNYVILEAKALLKSTNMTIQQIADELNFPSQSFFGKYFKRLVGVSPKEYKNS
ncbi:helix-turn-helix domain-containing protein [uncultured Bacteroides sp.]|uniref:helix-turn-helix domain-containing protein n=1 Tax=uncultured Bacteroides sp. TaxID=162156 RepID=UPI002AA68237|nr:helix-turn-helix domain-containing protein [uncultured Bacteroides sp.]